MSKIFVNDSDYSNFIFASPVLVAGALVKNKKDIKRKDAQHKVNMAELEKKEAENRISFAKSFEERRIAEQDKANAEKKLDDAKKEVEDVKNDVETPTNKKSKTKTIALIGGGIVLVGLVVFLMVRKKSVTQ